MGRRAQSGLSGESPVRVAVVQPYIASYRIQFFESLFEQASRKGIEIGVFAGAAAAGAQLSRSDSELPSWLTVIEQREVHIAGRRIVFRHLPKSARKSDILVLEQARRNVDIYRLLLPRFTKRQRLVLWGHGADHAGSRTVLEERIRRLLTVRADAFFAYTTNGRDAVVQQGRDESTTHALYNSNDTHSLFNDLVDVSDTERAAFADLHDLNSHTAVYVGALDHSKKISLLLESALHVHRTDPDFRLIIGGDGDQKQVVSDFATRHRFVKYLGRLSGRQKALALDASVVGLCLGAVGLVAVDYMTADIPVISTSGNADGPEVDYLESSGKLVRVDSRAEHVSKAVLNLIDRARLQEKRPRIPVIDGEPVSSEDMARRFVLALECVLGGNN